MTTIPSPPSPDVHFPSPSSNRKPVQNFGYTCQSYLALEIYKQVFSLPSYRVWFSKGFNPVQNVDSSNPTQIYLSLSRSVQTNDAASKIIRAYRMILLDTVEKNVPGILIKRSLRHQIRRAPVDRFRPQVWLLDLDAIARRNGTTLEDFLEAAKNDAENAIDHAAGQVRQSDEYLVTGLQDDDFIIIINE